MQEKERKILGEAARRRSAQMTASARGVILLIAWLYGICSVVRRQASPASPVPSWLQQATAEIPPRLILKRTGCAKRNRSGNAAL